MCRAQGFSPKSTVIIHDDKVWRFEALRTKVCEEDGCGGGGAMGGADGGAVLRVAG